MDSYSYAIATSGENFSKVQAYLLLAYLRVRNRGMVYIRLGTLQATFLPTAHESREPY